MFTCTIDWYDSNACKYYYAGTSYEINLKHHAELKTLKRFAGAEEAYAQLITKAKKKPEVKNEPCLS